MSPIKQVILMRLFKRIYSAVEQAIIIAIASPGTLHSGILYGRETVREVPCGTPEYADFI